MAITLKDGTGSGSHAKVTENGRITTLSVEEGIAAHHAFEGQSYNINTGTVNLTSASKSALLYFKNNEDEPIIVTGFFYLLGNPNNTGETLVQIERNPSSASFSTALTPINRDFGSQNTLTVDCYKGAEAATLSGGTVAIESLFSGVGRQTVLVGAVILRKGNSIGVTVTPPTSNTSMNVQIAMAVYKAIETTEV